MSDDTDVEQLLENVQKALDALNKIEDVEGLINKLDTRNNRKLLKKVKTVVSDVHGKVNTIKEKVSKAYKKVKIRSNSETDDSVVNDKDGSDKETAPSEGGTTIGATEEENVVEDPTNKEDTAGRDSPVAKTNDRNTRRCLTKRKNDAAEEENATEDIEIETNKEPDINSEVDNNEVETESNVSSSQDIIEATPEKQLKIVLTLKKNQTNNDESVGEIADCSVANDSLNVPEQDNETRSEEDKEKSDDQNNKNPDDENETEKQEEIAKSDEDPEIRIPKIKLVDINKLLDPNAKPLETTPVRKSRKSVTFDNSVIVLTSSDDDTPKKTPKEKQPTPLKSALRKASPKSIELSDSDSKENNENLRNTTTKKKSTVEQSSDDSDLEGNKGGSRRLRRHDKTIKERFSVLVKERRLRNYSKKSEDKESQKHTSKSKNKKLQSDSEDEDKDNRKLNNKKRRKKDILQESSLSEGSDNSDESDSEKLPAPLKGGSKRRKKANHAEPDANDPKFKAEVRINLPRFECEKLPELYKSKKEIFEIKKLSKISLSRRARREMSENKKVKLTLSLRDKGKSTGDSSDDEERSSTEENEDVAKSDEGLDVALPSADSMDNLAMSCLEQLNDEPEDDKSDGEAKKSKKKEASEEDNTEKSLEKETDKEPLLNGKLSDSEDGVENKRKETNSDSSEEELNNKKRKKKQDASDSNEEESDNKKGKKKKKDASDSSEEESNNTKGKKKKKKDASDSSEEESDNKKRRKKKKDASDSSEEESDNKKGRKKKKDASDSSEEESDNTKGKKKKKDASENSSDSDEDFGKFSRKKDKSKKDLAKEAKKRVKKKLISDSEESDKDNVKKKNDASDEDSDSSSHSGGDSHEEKDKEEKSKPTRRRIQRVKDSSSDDEEESTRKKIRKMIDRDSLSESTKKAERDERDRKARIAEKQEKYNKIFELKADATVDKVVLDFDDKTDKPLLSVHKKLVKQLKPHQVSGIKFMWDACFESLDRAKKTGGSGCILAHCMGLGKTLQVVALTHTLLTHSEKTGVEKILVVCPVNTVLNWKNEFNKWLPNTDDFEVFELVSCKETNVNSARRWVVKNWSENGGVLIIGYNMFRTLSNPQNKALAKSLKQVFQAGLVDPGPDLVVCDEGHLLKNEKTNLSIAMNRIKTARRIVLTGTPLQNNLREYWCMVQFIKPNLLGTYKEYLNRFVNPITNGQYTDSTQRDIMVMRRRSHVLHKLLDGVVQRQDYAVLEPYLPPKYEYVLFLQLTEVQIKLYHHYMDNFARKGNRTSFLFTDFQELQRICTHPRVLLDKSIENKEKKLNDESDSEGSIKEFLDDESDTSSSSSDENGSDSEISIRGFDSDASVRSVEKNKKKKKRGSAPRRGGRLTRAAKAARTESDDDLVELDDAQIHQKEWFDEYISRDELDNINHSAKIFLLFQILKECEEIGDKVLVFSQSLYTLNCLEYFLGRIDEATQKGDTEKVGGHSGSWSLGLDYFRLDGSSSCDNRANWCDQFNDPENTRARLFLISTKAGGLGINLVAANRVIIFDVSWNPSHDIQSIYRVYRFGQTKPSYIYRFVTNGTMEMKIYERQVTKQAISKRVIDEQQIDRHYSQNDIQELYKTDVEPTERPVPMVPKDVLLGEMVQKYDKTIFKFHEHQSLLENKQDEELNEDERKAAWEEFENEKVLRKTNVTNFGGIQWGAIQNNTFNYSPQVIQLALGNMVRKDNPTWSDVQIKGILPALVAQLQVQMSVQDFSMYNRVQQEIRIMQALHAQRMHQFQLQQQMMKQAAGVDLMITPEQIRQIQMAQASQNYIQPAQGPSRSRDVIELND